MYIYVVLFLSISYECDNSLFMYGLCLDPVMILNFVFVRLDGYQDNYGESHDRGH